MSRKYRQRGYQDTGGGDSPKKRPAAGRKSSREGPRSPRMMAYRDAFRCGMCGASLPPSAIEIKVSSKCPKCGEDLHTCKNCVYFDPGSRFECSQPIPERVSPKDKQNFCEYFEPRTRVEKSTTSSSTVSTKAVDPKEAFERLFKK